MSVAVFRILVICTGNIHRSPLAAALLETWAAWYLPAGLAAEIRVRSAGLAAAAGSPMSERVQRIAGEFGAEVREKLGLLGCVVELPDSDFDIATALMGCSPAYFALVAEALVEAGVAAGLEEKLVEKMVVEAAAGTGALLRVRPPADVRVSVTSPGGSTEAGLEALEREGAREAFEAAVRASLERMKG